MNAARALLVSLVVALAAFGAHAQEKVLRYAFPAAETGFDPAQLSDLYSRIITANIFDGLYGYDYLARPAKVKPVLADGMPVISPDWRTYTVKLRPGIYFADDPAFGGKKREVTAQDVVLKLARRGEPDEDFVELRQEVERDISAGVPPAAAASVRASGGRPPDQVVAPGRGKGKGQQKKLD